METMIYPSSGHYQVIANGPVTVVAYGDGGGGGAGGSGGRPGVGAGATGSVGGAGGAGCWYTHVEIKEPDEMQALFDLSDEAKRD